MKFVELCVTNAQLEECDDEFSAQYGFVFFDNYDYVCNPALSKDELFLSDDEFFKRVTSYYCEDAMNGMIEYAMADGITIDGNDYDGEWVTNVYNKFLDGEIE
jgi:hypothetical protein